MVSATGITRINNTIAGIIASSSASVTSYATPDLGRKLECIFGKALGDIHNIQRSTTMLNQLHKIGIFDNDVGRNYITQKIIESYYNATPTMLENGRYQCESLLMGPNGGLKLITIWEGTKLITINLIGG